MEEMIRAYYYSFTFRLNISDHSLQTGRFDQQTAPQEGLLQQIYNYLWLSESMDPISNFISFYSSSRIPQVVPPYVTYPDASQEESQRIYESLKEEYEYLQAQDSQCQRTRCISYSQEYKQAVKVGEQLKQLNQMVSEGRRFLQGVSLELQRLKDWMKRLKDPSYEGSTDEEEEIDSDRSAIQI